MKFALLISEQFSFFPTGVALAPNFGAQCGVSEMNQGVVGISFQSVEDLANRWHAARRSALTNSFPFAMSSEDEYLQSLRSLSAIQYDELLKNIFLNSRKLGLGFQKAFGLVWDLSDLVEFLPALKSPCLHGAWEISSSARQITRSGCNGGTVGGLQYCQYWREALDGLVTGLCENERFVRHEGMFDSCKRFLWGMTSDSRANTPKTTSTKVDFRCFKTNLVTRIESQI